MLMTLLSDALSSCINPESNGLPIDMEAVLSDPWVSTLIKMNYSQTGNNFTISRNIFIFIFLKE